MLSELFVFVIVICFSLNSDLPSVAQENEHELKTRLERDGSLFDVFKEVVTTVKHFFGIKTDEDKKHRKSAITEFYEELSKKKALRKPGLIKTYEPEPDVYASYLSGRKFYVKPETSAEQLIIAHGYIPESHTVITEDGYILTMQRVLTDSEKYPAKKRVVLLHHGLFGSSEDWLLIGQFRALPYMLSDSGFDVWLLNARGNKYSKIHTWKNPQRQDFWNFTFHEMALYDLPAAIKYVTEITGRAELHYIGHSLGCTVLLVLLSTIPEYNLVLKSGVLMAPLAFMYHARGPIRLLSDFYRTNGDNSLRFLGQSDFYPNGTFPQQLIDKFCKGTLRSCSNPLLLLCNGGRETVSDHLMEEILSHVPSGGSIKTLLHYIQLVKSGFFQNYDYGGPDNTRVYGNTTVPLYELEKVTLPISVFSSPSDWLSTVSDIGTLIPAIKNVKVHHIVNAEDFGHLEFLWSPDAPDLVYNFVLSSLDNPIEESA